MAAEVIRLDGEIAVLAGRVEQARQAYLTLAATLTDLQRRRADLAARVRAAVFVGAGSPTPPACAPHPAVPTPSTAPIMPPGGAPPASGRTSETSTRTVQSLLFILGGLLLGSAAIVFTVVAWTTFGLIGRAAILAGLTALTLAVPPVARWRGLRGAAETFAALGLLLVLLDGYAAWSVDLFGATRLPGSQYAALVAGVGALVAVGYRLTTRLAAPWFTALLLLQVVPPLWAVGARLGLFGWALVLAGLAALDLAVLAWVRRAPVEATTSPSATARRIAAGTAYGVALAVAALGAGVTLVSVSGAVAVPAGVPLLVTAVLLAGAGALTGRAGLRIAGAIAVTSASGVAVLRAALALDAPMPVTAGLVIAGLTVAVLAVERVGRDAPDADCWSGLRLGRRIGALLVVGGYAVLVGVSALLVAAYTAMESTPAWRADPDPAGGPFDWQLPVAALIGTAALVFLSPAVARRGIVTAGGMLTIFALPAGVALPWWGVCLVDLAAGTAFWLAVVRPHRPAGPVALVSHGVVGALLVGHAFLVGLARPAGATAVLIMVSLAALAVAVSAARPVAPPTRLRVFGGLGLAVGLACVPSAVVHGLFALGVSPQWQARAALAVLVVLAVGLLAVRRWRADYLPYAYGTVAAVALVVGLSPVLPSLDGESGASYAMAAASVLVAGALLVRSLSARIGPAVVVALLLIRAAGTVLSVVAVTLAGPYLWFGRIWSGTPTGVGLTPGDWRPSAGAAAALVLALGPMLVLGLRRPGGEATVPTDRGPHLLPYVLLVGLPALPAGLAAAGAGWPVAPAAALLGGLLGLLVAARSPAGTWTVRTLAVVGFLTAGAGFAGSLPTRASTLVALGAVLVAGAVVGASGRRPVARFTGWSVGALAVPALAGTAALAVDLPLRVVALVVLAASAIVLAGGVALRARRPGEALPVEAAGHAGAVVALLLGAGELRYAAVVAVLWGVVLGVRALHPAASGAGRWGYGVAAAACELLAVWLLLVAGKVTLLEAYTVPAAVCALAVGWWATRVRPLHSWLAYGPGLAAALLPSLVSVLVAGGQPERRLLLGLAALSVVCLGAIRRRQAPVLLGGATLAVGALREAVGVWDLLDRWVFLAVGGLVLIGLAVSYERRRRDLARLRAAVRRMD
jgi:hypothetical protein